MFFDWKIQPEKIQLTRDLSDNTMIYQGIILPCKNDQGYCDPTTRTQATIVWFPEDTCTTFQVAKIHARMIKFHEKYFIQSIPYEQVNPSRKQSSNFRNIHNIENKLTRFQIYQETENDLKKNTTQICNKSSITMRNRTTSYRNDKCNCDNLFKNPSNNNYRI